MWKLKFLWRTSPRSIKWLALVPPSTNSKTTKGRKYSFLVYHTSYIQQMYVFSLPKPITKYMEEITSWVEILWRCIARTIKYYFLFIAINKTYQLSTTPLYLIKIRRRLAHTSGLQWPTSTFLQWTSLDILRLQSIWSVTKIVLKILSRMSMNITLSSVVCVLVQVKTKTCIMTRKRFSVV